jgi:tetratricopeptide (TPR) repeat protein
MTGNGVPEVIRANTGVWSANLHRQLLTLHLDNPQDADLLQAVGLIEKRMGKFKEAERHFLQWVELDPKSSGALINLGNVYLATNRVENAVESYQKATQLDPSRTESYYNLGQAYLLNLLLQEADSEFRRAMELRPQLISFYTSISSRNSNRMAIDQTIEPSRLWRRILADTPDREKIAMGMWGILWNKIPLKYGELMGAALLAF